MYDEQYDESIDVYAFGMCLLEMATGEYPYQECTKPFEIYKRVTQGIKPENYHKIDDDDDLKELIDVCIRLKKHQRPTVKEVLNHSWFLENNGLKLELSRDEKTKRIVCKDESIITFRLKLAEKSKHKNWPDNEAIEFMFDVEKDNPENIAIELKESLDKINEEDVRYLTQSIKDKCFVFKLERDDILEDEQKQSNQNVNGANVVNSVNFSVTTATVNGSTLNNNNNTATSTINIDQTIIQQVTTTNNFPTAPSTVNLTTHSAAQSLTQIQFQQQQQQQQQQNLQLQQQQQPQQLLQHQTINPSTEVPQTTNQLNSVHENGNS